MLTIIVHILKNKKQLQDKSTYICYRHIIYYRLFINLRDNPFNIPKRVL